MGGRGGVAPSWVVVIVLALLDRLQQGATNEIRGDVAAHVVDVLLVFEDHAERVINGLRVEIDGAEGKERPRPVKGFGHSGGLEEIDTTQALGEADNLPSRAAPALRAREPERMRNSLS